MHRFLVVISFALCSTSCVTEPVQTKDQKQVIQNCNGLVKVLNERILREYGGFQIEFQAPSDLAAKDYEQALLKDFVNKYDLSLWVIRKGKLSNPSECRYVIDLISNRHINRYGVPKDQQLEYLPNTNQQ